MTNDPDGETASRLGPSPSSERVLLGFLIAPAVPVLVVMALVTGYALVGALGDGGVPSLLLTCLLIAFVGVGVAYIPALLIGVPAYVLLSRRMRLTAVNGAMAGAVLAALSGVVSTSGTSTSSGMLWVLAISALAGVLGALAGLAFWWIVTADLRARPKLR